MDLEYIVLKVKQFSKKHTNIICFNSYAESKKQMNKHSKINRLINSENKQVVGGEGCRRMSEIDKGD